MFLSVLSNDEKVKFLNLLNNAANVDGDFSEVEQKQIDAYINEMGLSPEQVKFDPLSTEELLAYFSEKSSQIKKCVFVELLALVFVDGKYTEIEKNLLKQTQIQFSLSNEFEKEATDWINEITPMYVKGFKLVELM